MYKHFRWVLIVGILLVALAWSFRLELISVPGEVRSELCPTAFAATEDSLVKTPTREESGENTSFEYFCAMVTRDHPNLRSLNREIIASDQSVTIILFAYFNGEKVEKAVRTEKQITPPLLCPNSGVIRMGQDSTIWNWFCLWRKMVVM